MGVPHFFKWFTEGTYAKDIEDFDNIVESTNIPENIHHLFIDFNAFIFDILNKIENNPDERKKYEILSKDELETMLTNQIIDSLQNYVKQINPLISLGIFADGVVPMAKINTKRHATFWRTFYRKREMSIPLDEDDKEEIKMEKPVFPRIMVGIISPFMIRLFDEIYNKAIDNFFGDLEITLSGVNFPGEGEHKIISHIRENSFEPGNKIFIFSTDADMIFLSCLLPEHQMHMSTRIEETPVIIDITKFALKLFTAFTAKHKIQIEFKKFIFDFVFLCFFVGNDYIQHLPGYIVEYDGIDILLSIYAKTLTSVQEHQRFFVYREKDRTMINNYFLLCFFYNLSLIEQNNLQILTQKRVEKYRIQESWSEAKIAKNKILYLAENENFKKFHSPIKYNLDSWKEQYRACMFDVDSCNLSQFKRVHGHIWNYLQGIMFCTRMYFDSHVSWEWFNQNYVAPLSSDIYYLVMKNFKFNINQIVLSEGFPVEPVLQNLLIYPRYMKNYIPDKFLEILNKEEYNKYYFFNHNNIFPYEKDLITDIPGTLPNFNNIMPFFKSFYEQNKHLI